MLSQMTNNKTVSGVAVDRVKPTQLVMENSGTKCNQKWILLALSATTPHIFKKMVHERGILKLRLG